MRSGKTHAAILSLPASPTKHIYWIVYNQDMINYTRNLIAELRGEDYLKHITVVAKGDSTKDRSKGTVYFDPLLYNHLGNGNV